MEETDAFDFDLGDYFHISSVPRKIRKNIYKNCKIFFWFLTHMKLTLNHCQQKNLS